MTQSITTTTRRFKFPSVGAVQKKSVTPIIHADTNGSDLRWRKVRHRCRADLHCPTTCTQRRSRQCVAPPRCPTHSATGCDQQRSHTRTSSTREADRIRFSRCWWESSISQCESELRCRTTCNRLHFRQVVTEESMVSTSVSDTFADGK